MIDVRFLSSFSFCPRKIYLEEVLKLKKPQDVVSQSELKRRILQEALQFTNGSEEGIVKGIKIPIMEQKISQSYRQSAKRSLQEAMLNNREDIAKAELSILSLSEELQRDLNPFIKKRVDNTYEYAKSHQLTGIDLWWALSPKMKFSQNLSDEKLGIEMCIERVDIHKDKSVPFVFKKNNAPEKGVWPGDKYLIAAAMLLLKSAGHECKEGFILYNNGETRRMVQWDSSLEGEIVERKEALVKLLTQESVPGRVSNEKKCTHCMRKERCFDDAYIADRLQAQREFKKTQRNL